MGGLGVWTRGGPSVCVCGGGGGGEQVMWLRCGPSEGGGGLGVGSLLGGGEYVVGRVSFIRAHDAVIYMNI